MSNAKENKKEQKPVVIAVPEKAKQHLVAIREKMIRLQIEHDAILQTILNVNDCSLPYTAFKFTDQHMNELIQVQFPE